MVDKTLENNSGNSSSSYNESAHLRNEVSQKIITAIEDPSCLLRKIAEVPLEEDTSIGISGLPSMSPFEKYIIDFLKSMYPHISSFPDNEKKNISLIKIAIIDIANMAALSINLINNNINSKKIKGLIYLNMVRGKKSGENYSIVIYEYFKNHMEIDLDELLAKLNELNLNTTPSRPICPFHESENKNPFIEGVWNLFHEKIIPSIQEKYQHSQNPMLLFSSGNSVIKNAPSR